jgi:hypothetical protein
MGYKILYYYRDIDRGSLSSKGWRDIDRGSLEADNNYWNYPGSKERMDKDIYDDGD